MRAVFLRILGPLLVPGILAAAILVLVRTVGMFELTFLTAGPDSQTLVVALYYAMSAAGIRAQQSVDAMAVIYTSTMLVLLVVALRFVNPTQLVARVKEAPDRKSTRLNSSHANISYAVFCLKKKKHKRQARL